jgi:diaminohydroxyphosphoribosylaminopyrimidine deaminase / 5-amino-6-(5-phosphoribosylamino)uracil reductase
VLKTAMSLDGKIALANGQSQWITAEAARTDVQHWRARSCAILTGIGTVLADDPRLNVRLEHQHVPQPLRIVLDRDLRTPITARLFTCDGAILIVHRPGADAERASALRARGAELLVFDESSGLISLLSELAKRAINELWIEAGAGVAGAFVQQDLVDQLVLYQAPVLLGASAKSAYVMEALSTLDAAPRWQLVERRQVGDDQRLIFLRRVRR